MAKRRRHRRRRGKIADATPAQSTNGIDDSASVDDGSVSNTDAGDDTSGGDD